MGYFIKLGVKLSQITPKVVVLVLPLYELNLSCIKANNCRILKRSIKTYGKS